MIRVAVAELAFYATLPALQMPGWTEPQLAELQSQWEQIEFFKMASSTIEMERAHTFELIFERARTNGWQPLRGGAGPLPPAGSSLKDIFEERVLGPLWRVSCAEQDELFYLENMQRVLEALRSAARHQSWKRLSVELSENFNRIDTRLKAPDAFRFSLSGMAFINWRRVFENVMRQETQRSLMIAAIALQRYHLRHGKFPADLESLVPEFLAAVPVDGMDGRPLRYRVEPDGSFRLYSVGLNGKDDGGNPEAASAWKSISSIFDGRDAVSPRLASSQEATAGNNLEILQSVEFLNAPLREVIRALAKQADLRVRINPEVDVELLPSVTFRLENMTALDVLESVLRSNGLVLVKHPGTNLLGITTTK
jgi:hypothetical protein